MPAAMKPRRPFVPFIRSTSLEFLTRGETKAVQCVALQLHFGMVRAMQDRTGCIEATWKEVGEWAGVSYASVKRAVIRLRELGWVRELPGHRILFDYSKRLPKKAQIEPDSNGVEPSRKDNQTHPIVLVPVEIAVMTAPLGDALVNRSGTENNQVVSQADPQAENNQVIPQPVSEPSMAGQAIAVLVSAGADRAGAVKAVKIARKENRLDLGTLARITEAVSALPTKPYRPGGLICAAVIQPKLGSKLIRDHAAAVARKGAPGCPRMPQDVPNDSGRASVLLKVPESPWEVMRRQIADWLTVADPVEDREWLLAQATRRGWTLADLRSVPGLAGLTMP